MVRVWPVGMAAPLCHRGNPQGIGHISPFPPWHCKNLPETAGTPQNLLLKPQNLFCLRLPMEPQVHVCGMPWVGFTGSRLGSPWRRSWRCLQTTTALQRQHSRSTLTLQ